MDKIEKYILMYKDFKVLSFAIDLQNITVQVNEKLEHFDKAPHCLLIEKDIDIALLDFLIHRCIPVHREDYQELLKATGFSSGLELSFQAHGLSLSNHYWYQKEGENLSYEDINFFLHKWDDSFARAILKQDYEALKNCDLNVPDLTTQGWGIKGWIYEDDGPKLYKLGIHNDHGEEALGEVLASRIAKRLFNEKEVIDYELKKAGDRYASVSPLITSIDEDLMPLSDYTDSETYRLYKSKTANKELASEFYRSIGDLGIPGLREFFVKLACLKDLCFVSDLHFHNISLIKNEKTGQIRIAPLYDLGGAFGSTRNGKNIITNANKGTLMLIYFLFSDLDPSWDYSWYKPEKLIGVEEDIQNTLSKSDFYTPKLIDYIIKVYKHQKATLDKMANKVIKS